METARELNIPIPVAEVRAFCTKWHVRELALFGSVLRDDFRPDSDVDVLVTFEPGAGNSLEGYIAMRAELAGILGRNVDLVNREAVIESHNWLRRRRILDSARTVYAA